MDIEFLADYPQHLDELAALHFAEWGYLNPGQTLAHRIESLRDCCVRNAIPSVVVALDGDDLVGSALLVAHDMDNRPELTPWLAGVFVKPAFRHRGVGSALVRRIEAEAAALEVKTLYLFTPDADRLYRGLGWSALEPCVYKETHVMIMSKRLAG